MRNLSDLKKELGIEFLKKIDNYKDKNNKSYNEIAEIVGVGTFCFANLRYRIKKEGIYPSETTLKKFKDKGII